MIRKLKQKEIPTIARYYEKIMKEQFEKIGERSITKERYKKILEENFKHSFMFVLENKGIKSFIWFIKKNNEINLEELFSTEKGKGYGKQLINFLLDYSKNEKIKRINIDVHFKNKEALNFFKKLGFSERTIELSLDI
jgi:L-amino acid N-acyltransferase YncA